MFANKKLASRGGSASRRTFRSRRTLHSAAEKMTYAARLSVWEGEGGAVAAEPDAAGKRFRRAGATK